MSDRTRRAAAAAALLLLPLLLFSGPLSGRVAFIPADLLRYVAPWNAESPPPQDAASWNVLRYDGVTQFYPWRLEAARSWSEGRVPLWNPHQFAFAGGTPLLADSQSAPLYPLGAVFWLTPRDRFWYAFGLSAALHLLIAAVGLFALLRAAVGLRRTPALLGAATFALSGPVVTWLSLPTFLAVSCWVPWLLLLIRYAHDGAGRRAGRLAAAGAGAVAGMMLLAGHLQMAFYGMLAGALYALFLGVIGVRERRVRPGTWLIALVAGAALAVCLALPQVLPALELSRSSHRNAAVSSELYGAYVRLAVPPRNLVTFLAPDFFGSPNAGLYWNDSDRRGGNNYAEWALYVGVLPLLLGLFAVALPWRGVAGARMPRERAFFALLGGVALLLAFGTPLNLALFWGVPGYAQTGNPGRSLFLFALAASALAAIGLEALTGAEALTPDVKRRAGLVALAVAVLTAALGASRAAAFAKEALPDVPFSALMQQAQPGMLVAGVLLAPSAVLLLAAPSMNAERRRAAGVLALLLAVADLAFWGGGYNPTSAPDAVYPVTPGLRFLQENARGALIAPINVNWTLGGVAPPNAVLPPNALTVYGLRDASGYDSLFPRAYKDAVAGAGGVDPSPPANGNMVFLKSVEAALRLGAQYIVTAPGDEAAARLSAGEFPALVLRHPGPDMLVFENPDGRVAPDVRPQAPASFRAGLFLGMVGLGALTAALAGGACVSLRRRGRRAGAG